MADLNTEVTPELEAALDKLANEPGPPLSPEAEAALKRLSESVERALNEVGLQKSTQDKQGDARGQVAADQQGTQGGGH